VLATRSTPIQYWWQYPPAIGTFVSDP